MLSSVEADQPNVYVHSGAGEGVVDTAPVFPQSPPMTVDSTWSRSRDQTIEFWFKAAPLGTNTMPIVSVGISSAFKMILSVRRSNHTVEPGKLWLQLSNNNGGQYHNNYYSINRYDDGKWHHCVIVLSNMFEVLNQYFYIDGELESQNYVARSFTFGSWGNTRIGDCSHLASGYTISGSPLDEIALYNKALSPERILAHYNEVMASPPGPSVAIAGQIDISGSVKTNKLVRLNTAQFDVDGFIRALILKDPLPFSIASQIDILGNVKAALAGKPVATSTRMQSSEIDAIVQTGIGIRL